MLKGTLWTKETKQKMPFRPFREVQLITVLI